MLNKYITKLNNQTVNNQLFELQIKIKKVTIAIFISLFLIATILWGFSYFRINDPYLQTVLSIQGNIDRGESIFKVNCAGCHSNMADKDVGPSLSNVTRHLSKKSLINQVISGKNPPMPQFQPSTQDMADLLSYLEKL
jgi:mono/diheme cytochrome c family protein